MAQDFGLGVARADRIHGDTFLRHLQRQRARQADYAMFGGHISGHIRIPSLPRRAGDVDDAPGACSQHVGQGSLGAQKGAGEVHVQHALPEFGAGFAKRRTLGLACVVDEHADGAECGTRLGEALRHCIGVADIHHHYCAAGDGLQALCEGLQHRLATPGQCQHRALVRQCFGNGRTNTLRSPGDEHMAAFQRARWQCAHHAASFTTGAAAMAFSRAKIDSIWPLPDTYCLGQAMGV